MLTLTLAGTIEHHGLRYSVVAGRRKANGNHEVIVSIGTTTKRIEIDGKERFGTGLLRRAVQQLTVVAAGARR